MDDGGMDFKRGKPQQQFYKPGSGPLKKTPQSLEIKMDNYTFENDHQNKEQDNQTKSVCKQQTFTNSSRCRKPEQQLYSAKTSMGDLEKQTHLNNSAGYSSLNYEKKSNENHGGSYSRGNSARRDNHNKNNSHNDVNYNRNYRQVSEPRTTSPSQNQRQPSRDRRVDRDSRSMETSAHTFAAGGKPPSGRRNSSGYPTDNQRHKYSVNIDNLPPRLRKKFLAESGKHVDNGDKVNSNSVSHHQGYQSYNPSPMHVPQQQIWSNTLPSRGRGRLRDEGLDKDKLISQCLRGYDDYNSRRSTPSGSYTNLYESQAICNSDGNINNHSIRNLDTKSVSNLDNKNASVPVSNNNKSPTESIATADSPETKEPVKIEEHQAEAATTIIEKDSDDLASSTTNLLDITNLDWTEEVETNIKLEDDSSTSSPLMQSSSIFQDVKPAETHERKRSGKGRRNRDKRSSSRNNKNNNNLTQNQNGKPERNRRDSGQFDNGFNNQRPRERRDSHRSNVSSNIGNSRDDLDRWRSLRSYSREHSNERRIVSQCNSRDTSITRALSPRFNEGFRVPAPVNQTSSKNSGRNPSADRGRQSPVTGSTGGGGERSARRGRRKSGRRKNNNNAENTPVPAPQTWVTDGAPTTNWREEILESNKIHHNDRGHEPKKSKSVDKSSNGPGNHPGLIVLPAKQKNTSNNQSQQAHKTLYDPHNPSKPIIVQTSPGKEDVRMDRGASESASRGGCGYEAGDAARAARHRALLQQVDRADALLQAHTIPGAISLADHWNDLRETRTFLQQALQQLLMSDLKFCQTDNVEHHFWKILYYNLIEKLRSSLPHSTPEDKTKLIGLINTVIEEGNSYYEGLVQMLEKTYKFSADTYINDNHLIPPKGLGYVGLALISIQKLFIFLGDLARYKEQVNESNNYAKSKLWYTKAQQINPKNGKPYNQLAILAIYARRKLDAVYYYMRSLMSSNPFQSARESLLPLFEENRKKYEAAERKRRAAREAAGAAESGASSGAGGGAASGRGLRREVWVRPSGRRTTTLRHDNRDQYLSNMTSVELNKSFITSYLHVHGKLITKIGMETFHESAALMLKQFRALLHQQPLPTSSARLLQLTALNIFAVESITGTHKDKKSSTEEGTRSAWLECALGISLLMFGALLERCCALLPEPIATQQHSDALLLMPAIKVWSDWMLCHSSVWNPPPCLDDFDLGVESDPWDWLAKLMNILEVLDDKCIEFQSETKEGLIPVRLPEDVSLAGFTPLMYMEPTPTFVRTMAPQLAEHALRMRKLLFFGTEYLVGVEPPVLKLECPLGESPFYASAVHKPAPRRLNDEPLHELSEDSEEESTATTTNTATTPVADTADTADEATRKLLRRKEQLEVRRANIERRKQRMQELLRGGWVSVEVEVRPRWLVPDTNCFIEHLALLQRVAAAPGNPYLLTVPLVVVTELEGLSKCTRIGESAVAALSWLQAGAACIKYVTSRGSLLTSSAFTAESAGPQPRTTNDDRVLSAALSLHTSVAAETASEAGRCIREVVLLTDDRNLRVKALAADLPARDLPAFLQWATLPTPTNA